MRQKGILLTLIKAVHFIDKENGAAAGLTRFFGKGDGFADFLDAGQHRR